MSHGARDVILLKKILTLKTAFKVSQLFETIGKCQIQFDNLSYWPEHMQLVKK